MPEERKRIEKSLEEHVAEPSAAAAIGRKKTSKRLAEDHIKAWVANVFDRQHEIDPTFERDWFDMAFGFFLARGLSPDDALELTLEVENRNLL